MFLNLPTFRQKRDEMIRMVVGAALRDRHW